MPSPEMESQRGAAPAECVAIEDSERGLMSAVNAGMRCLVVHHPLSQDGDFSRATAVFDAIRDLRTWLESEL